MGDQLVVDFGADGRASISLWLNGQPPSGPVSEPFQVWSPLDDTALEDLRWYLEDYLRAPYGVYGDRGSAVASRLADWGESLFEALFGSGPGRDAYLLARAREQVPTEVVLRSDSASVLGLPWELLRDPSLGRPLALDAVGVSRSVHAGVLDAFDVSGEQLRVLMVISRPAGGSDVGYRMIARPLLERLEAVRGRVELVVLRPPTLAAMERALTEAAAAGQPFQVVHFDGHGALACRGRSGPGPDGSAGPEGPGGEGMLVFERPGGGRDLVPAATFAQVLTAAQVPVVVLNACQSGAVGKELEAMVATRLLQAGAASVVAMAYSVYAVAAAEFMAAFYERLFAGGGIADAVGAGRLRLYQHNRRPSPKGLMALQDWLVPVHYLRQDLRFPDLRADPDRALSFDDALERIADCPAPETNAGDLEPVGDFVGRDALFYQLEMVARFRRVVVLHGPGGTGKTELAKAFGRWWADTGGVEFPQWVIFHSFEPGVASFGLDGLIAAVGLRVFGTDFTFVEPAERPAVIDQLLGARRLLLILDNFESVEAMPDPTAATPRLDDVGRDEYRAFLQRVAAVGSSAVIITSRSHETWLGDLPRIEVGGLNADEAIDYAQQLLAPYPAAIPRRAKQAFGELLEWFDGHPLSMRVILPHLATTEPEVLLGALSGEGDLPGADAGAQRTSLAASVAYSFDQMTGAARRLLVALCLFCQVADRDVLARFSQVPDTPRRFGGATGQQWGEVMDRAAAVGLLTDIGGGMYRFPPALPAFLAARWCEEEPFEHHHQRQAAVGALLAAYAELGERLHTQTRIGDAGVAYAVIGRQRRNLGAFLGVALDTRRWAEAEAIATALNEYWDARGLSEEADGWVERARVALEDPDGTPPPLDGPAGALWLFFVESQASRQVYGAQLDTAERTYLHHLEILQAQSASSGQLRHLAVTHHQLGMIALGRGQLDEAEDQYRKSVTMFTDLGDRPGIAATYGQLGLVDLRRGRFDDAQTWYDKSLAISEDLGDRPNLAANYYQLGMVSLGQQRLDDAETWYQKSLAFSAEVGDRTGMASTYFRLGNLAHVRTSPDEAEDWYRRSLTIYEGLGDQPGIAGSYFQLGTLAHDRGRIDEAEGWYRKSLTISEELGHPRNVAQSYHQLGALALDQSRFGEAETWYRKSLAIFEELGDRPHLASTYQRLGQLSEQAGRLAEALEWTVRNAALFTQFPHPTTRSGSADLARLAGTLGAKALSSSWLRVTGRPVPRNVKDFIDAYLMLEQRGGSFDA